MTSHNPAAQTISDDVSLLSESSSVRQPASLGYPYWQRRILYSLAFGYAAFYLVRQNFSLAIPTLIQELGYNKTQLGFVISIWSIVYGVGKFVNGFISDRSNARYFMSLGLLGSALTSLVMGFNSGFVVLVMVWGLNAWFQSMGWPPVSRLLTHWFNPQELGTKWGITNLSHQVGGTIIAASAGYIILYFGWRGLFILPGLLCVVFSYVLYNRLRDTPESMGMPSIETYSGLKRKTDFCESQTIMDVLKVLLSNKLIWYVCMGNMFLYIVRMGIFNWAPTFLQELKGASVTSSGWQVATFEIAGMAGGVIAGWLSDTVFKGRRGPVSLLYMLALVGALCYFRWVPAGYDLLNSIAMVAVGFFVYGPQVLVGVAAADFSSKQVVGVAVGLTGTFGYVGTAISGVSIGYIADHHGWDGGFLFFIVSALLACVCFGLTWGHRAKVLEEHPQ